MNGAVEVAVSGCFNRKEDVAIVVRQAFSASGQSQADVVIRRSISARCLPADSVYQGVRKFSTSLLLCCAFMAVDALAATDAGRNFGGCLTESTTYREQGDLRRSIETLADAAKLAGNDAERARLNAELGTTLLQAHQYDPAGQHLKEAYAYHQGIERARDALQLGNLALHRKQAAEARRYYEEAQRLARTDVPLRLAAALNLDRLAPRKERPAQLASLEPDIAKVAEPAARARLQLNLAAQARSAGSIELAYRNTIAARDALAPVGNSRLSVEAYDALAQLYEDQGRAADAALLNAEGLARAGQLDLRSGADLRVNLEWRQARLLRQAGQREAALAAYQRAADQLEKIRMALPIEYEDGRSTYSATIEPLYLGLAELLLDQVDTQPPAIQAIRLRKARDVIELTRQAEMQDFLGDRCAVANIGSGDAAALTVGTAALYPVLLSDHTELLLETQQGFVRRRVAVAGNSLRATAKEFAEQLRDGDRAYKTNARQLYDWLIRPVEDTLTQSQTKTLIMVPNGILRLVAMAALNDGRQFLIEKYALASATGLSMTETTAPPQHNIRSLVAGLSEPGPVVAKLEQQSMLQILSPGTERRLARRGIAATLTTMRAVPLNLRVPAAAKDQVMTTAEDMKRALALPGVKKEVLALGRTLKGVRLLDQAFTVSNFNHEAESGEYRILHIASHGMFGGNAETSFILAYDDLLTLNNLEALLKSEHFRKNPIEILSLSACQTAEGNERAPLGIAGAAIKAQARSVVGTLWPVEDNSARILMEHFYDGLSKEGLSKSEALRQAQIGLIKTDKYQHPLFWAPFTLIGNWQ